MFWWALHPVVPAAAPLDSSGQLGANSPRFVPAHPHCTLPRWRRAAVAAALPPMQRQQRQRCRRSLSTPPRSASQPTLDPPSPSAHPPAGSGYGYKGKRGAAEELEGSLGVLLVDFLRLYGRALNNQEVRAGTCLDGLREPLLAAAAHRAPCPAGPSPGLAVAGVG